MKEDQLDQFKEEESSIQERLPGPSKKCNCKNSRCIKLYCECYQAKVFCDQSCHCQSCFNNPNNERFRNVAIKSTLERNPSAFQPKINQDTRQSDPLLLGKHNRGCACRKSGCMKKYCECFQAGVPCSDMCKCSDCRNHGYLTREHFLKSTNQQAEDSSQQNFLYQLLLAKDNDHLQNLLSEQSLLGHHKAIFQMKDIEVLAGKMFEVASLDDQELERQAGQKIEEEISIKQESKEDPDDLICKEEVRPLHSQQSFEENGSKVNYRKQIILDLFINILKSVDQQQSQLQ